ncbi:MAG: hypothetical protein SynsKO_15670 [Synoicihabitans sp.]
MNFKRVKICVLSLLVALPVGRLLHAQTLITGFTTSITTGSGDGIGTQDEIDFSFTNVIESLDSFTTATNTYTVSGLADKSFVRRNSSPSNADQTSIWYARSGSSTYTAEHAATVENVLLGNTFRRGSDNTFVNGDAGRNDRGNIERVDFVFSGGLSATPELAFTVMDRGGNTNHDRFQIALITGWNNTTDQVTSYSDITGQGSLWGSGNPEGNFNYQIFRYNNGNDSSDSYATQSGSGQGMGGLVFDIDDFNVTAGTTIYGYSLFGYDVSTGGDTNNLIDWNNSTYFPTNTSNNNGGIDLAGINGLAFSVVPEPLAWTVGGIALIVMALFRRRPRRTAHLG